MNWAEIRTRLATIKPGEIAQLFSDVLGTAPDWLVVYSDWLRRWGMDGECGGSYWSEEAVRTCNLDSFLIDSLTPCPSDPEALAILTALRMEFDIKPRDGRGRQSGEVLGLMRQAMREHAIARSTAARQRGEDWESVYRSGLLEHARTANEILCGLVGLLADRLGILEADCFCGQHRKASSEPTDLTFENGFRFSPELFVTLKRLIDSLPQTKDESWPSSRDEADRVEADETSRPAANGLPLT